MSLQTQLLKLLVKGLVWVKLSRLIVQKWKYGRQCVRFGCISAPDYTIMDACRKVDHLLEVVGDVMIPVDTAQVTAAVPMFLCI